METTRLAIHVLLVVTLVAAALPAINLGDMSPAPKGFITDFQSAMSNDDRQQREQAVREVLKRNVSPTIEPPELVQGVHDYLSMHSRWLDLRPFAELLLDPSLEYQGMWRQLLASNSMRFYSREDRLDLCRRAIREGSVEVSYGYQFSRRAAIMHAAWKGLWELEEDIEAQREYLDDLDMQTCGGLKTGFERVHLILELTASNSATGTDALESAFSKIAKQDPWVLRERMETDPVYQDTVVEMARKLCEINPFDGSQEQGCEKVREVVVSQQEINNQLKKSQGSETWPEDSTPNWLSWMASFE